MNNTINNGMYNDVNNGMFRDVNSGPNNGTYNGINNGMNNGMNNGVYNGVNRGIYGGGNNRLKPKTKVSFNAPVTLTFVIVCCAALVLDIMTNGFTNDLLFSVYRSSLLSPFTYVRMFGHAIGHADWSHLMGNMMIVLILGPLLEEKYGSRAILMIMIVTAFVTGLASFIFFPNIQLLGASGIVFALILLSSFTSIKEGEIPLTFILVALLYIGEQIYDGIFIDDDISNFTHILGGICGAAFGYLLNKGRSASAASGTNVPQSTNIGTNPGSGSGMGAYNNPSDTGVYNGGVNNGVYQNTNNGNHTYY